MISGQPFACCMIRCGLVWHIYSKEQSAVHKMINKLQEGRFYHGNVALCYLTFMPLPPSQDEKAVDKDQQKTQSLANLCWLAVGFMGPDEVTVTPPVPCIMRVVIVLYRLSSCTEYCLVPNQQKRSNSILRHALWGHVKGGYIWSRCQMNRRHLKSPGSCWMKSNMHRKNAATEKSIAAFTWYSVRVFLFYEMA